MSDDVIDSSLKTSAAVDDIIIRVGVTYGNGTDEGMDVDGG